MSQTKEQKLLSKLYECQEEMEFLLKDGKDDIHYQMMCELIKRLEQHLCDCQELM